MPHWQPPVTVAIESTGYAMWFHALMHRLGHTVVVGDAAKIRASVVRKTKTDRRDARHILTLLAESRFPAIWVPDPTTRDLRALIAHRMRLVRLRTMVRNGVHAIALNYRLALGSSLFTRRGLAALRALPLPRHTARRRDESLELLTWLDAHTDQLDAQIATAASADPEACRLMTHPGVGPLTALATILVLGPVNRFPSSKHVVGYVGLAPAIASSAGAHHLGGITKQGNRLLRYVLGQAGQIALRRDADLKRLYYRVLNRRGKARAKVAVARVLLVRLYIMRRDQIDYPASTLARSRPPGLSRSDPGEERRRARGSGIGSGTGPGHVLRLMRSGPHEAAAGAPSVVGWATSASARDQP